MNTTIHMKKQLLYSIILLLPLFTIAQIYVPDDNFEQALIDLGYDSGPLDNLVPFANISGVTSLDVSSKGISDLTGINGFPSIQTLYCNDNQLSTINLSNNLQLRDLRLNDNNLLFINLSNLTQLEIFSASNNQLSSINVASNPGLRAIVVSQNNLTTLDTSSNPFLVQIFCDRNQLTSLTIDTFSDLRDLYCYDNQLTSIDLTTNFYVEILWCRSNQLTSINTTGVTNLTTYVAYDNQLTSIDVSTNTALNALSLGDNNLSAINVSNNPFLTELYVGKNNLTTVDITSNPLLEEFWCNENQLTTVNTSGLTNLKTYVAYENQISAIDVSTNTALDAFSLGNNNLSTVDLSVNTQLTQIYVQNCPNLEELNVKNGANQILTNFSATDNPNLSCIEVDNAAISTANWTGVDPGTSFNENCNYGFTYVPDDAFEQALIDLGYDTAPLDDFVPKTTVETILTLDVSSLGIVDMTGIEDFVALEQLNCSGNAITNIDISTNTLLTNLNVNSNMITELDISNNLALINLNVSKNDIRSLDLNNHGQLTNFDGSTNDFLVLLIKNGNNTNFTNFSTLDNPDLTCIEVDDTAYSTTNWVNIDSQTSFNLDCQQFYTYVPDDAFEQFLIDSGYDSGMLDNYVLTANINTIVNLNLRSQGISDLTGIEDFVALEELDCAYNILTSIDISANSNLEELNCGFNLITSIDVTNNTALQSLTIWTNDVSTIDLSNNLQLRYLDVDKNNLTILDVSLNTQLFRLFCADNNLERLNVKNGNNINFTSFSARRNPNLSCIEVDNAGYSAATWTSIDSGVSFNENCNYGFTYVPDDAFEQALINLGYDTAPLDDFVPTATVEAILTLDISNLGITDLTGVEDFTALQELNCSSNALGTLDIRNNSNLTSLNCASNTLTTLDILNNSNLITLNVSGNSLTELNVINNSLLESVNINTNNITILNLSFHPVLNEVYAENNALQMLNIKNGNNTNFVGFSAIGNPSLTCIQVDDSAWSTTNWTSIDMQTSFNVDCGYGTYVPDDNFEQALINLGYDSGPLDDFVPTANINTVTNLNIIDKGITDLTGIEDFTDLISINCSNNSLTNLNVSHNNSLTTLYCGVNNLTYLNVNTPELFFLNCESNELTALDLSNNPELVVLNATNNEISELDVNANIKLRSLVASENEISEIDVSTNTLLELISLNFNKITTIDVRNCPALLELYFTGSELQTIDLSNNINLNTFSCAQNNLTTLDVSANINLISIDVRGSNLTTIDVSTNSLLEVLEVSDNFISELLVDTNPNLIDLRCNRTKIESLDLSNNPNLSIVFIGGNKLNTLNVQNGNNSILNSFDTQMNPDLYCVLVDEVPYSVANWTFIDPQTEFNNTSCNYITLNAKVLLQGASLHPNTGEEVLMRDDLRINGLISATSPYGDGATISELVRANNNVENSMIDWVWVELRDINNPSNVIDGQSGILQRDGDIVATSNDLVTPLTFDAIPVGKYHVVVKHRNHLGVMTASTVTLKQGTTIVDFTNATNQITFGSNAQTSFGMQANKMGMWAGNVNGDTLVQYSGTNPDTPTILSTVLNAPGNFLNFPTYSINAYLEDDLNLDGNIQYSGTNPDTPVILQNVLAHPGNFLNFSTFQITEQLPEND